MVASTTIHIPITSLPSSATKSHGFNHLAYRSLFSFVQAWNNNRTAVFDKQSVKTFKYTEVSIKNLCPPTTQIHLNEPSQHIYLLSLPDTPKKINKENATINFPSIQDCIDF